MGYYIDQLAEQDRQRKLAELLQMQEQGGGYSDMFNPNIPLPSKREYTGNTLADLARNPDPNWSQETKDALARRADLSGTLRVSHNGNDVSNLFDSGGGGQAQVQQPGFRNTLQIGDNAPVDLGRSQRSHDVWADGPQEIGRYQLANGTTEIIRKIPVMRDGRQSVGMERLIETPDYLNPAKTKQLQYQKLQREAMGEGKESTYDKKMSELKAQYDAENKFYGVSGAQREANALNQKMLERRFGNAPAGSRWDEKGNAIQIPVFDAAGNPVNSKDSKATEDEKKTAYHASKMLDSINRIGQLSKESTDAMTPGIGEAMAASTAGAYSGTANVARSGNRQAVFGLQADLVDSLLYLATGAAYNKEQLEQKRESLLPAFTDKPEAIEEKKRSLQQYMTAAKIRAGNAWKPEMESALKSIYADSAAAKETKAPPANGTVKGGYVFIGGDPAKESSWKKVQ